ncbi:MAG: SPASM domain-containing protein, partial [bacterium]
GGEPLLRMNTIEKSVRYIAERIEPGRSCLFTVTTNGTLLDVDVIKFLLDNYVSINVSLDGPRQIHDRFRVYPDGRGTYDEVIAGIERITAYASTLDRELPVTSGINMTLYGGFDFVELWDYLTSLEELLCTPKIRYLINWNTLTGGLSRWNEHNPDCSLNRPTGWNELLQIYEQACLDGVYRVENRPLTWRMSVLDDLVRRAFYFDLYCRKRYQMESVCELPKMFHPGSICLPGKRRPYIMADGVVLPCERVPTGYPYLHIGNIKDGILVKEAQRLVNDFTTPTIEECKECWCIRICSVGCLSEMMIDGIPNGELKRRGCRRVRAERHAELVGMCTLLEENPEALEHYEKVVVS